MAVRSGVAAPPPPTMARASSAAGARQIQRHFSRGRSQPARAADQRCRSRLAEPHRVRYASWRERRRDRREVASREHQPRRAFSRSLSRHQPVASIIDCVKPLRRVGIMVTSQGQDECLRRVIAFTRPAGHLLGRTRGSGAVPLQHRQAVDVAAPLIACLPRRRRVLHQRFEQPRRLTVVFLLPADRQWNGQALAGDRNAKSMSRAEKSDTAAPRRFG